MIYSATPGATAINSLQKVRRQLQDLIQKAETLSVNAPDAGRATLVEGTLNGLKASLAIVNTEIGELIST